jgi:hypothetical protein
VFSAEENAARSVRGSRIIAEFTGLKNSSVTRRMLRRENFAVNEDSCWQRENRRGNEELRRICNNITHTVTGT